MIITFISYHVRLMTSSEKDEIRPNNLSEFSGHLDHHPQTVFWTPFKKFSTVLTIQTDRLIGLCMLLWYELSPLKESSNEPNFSFSRLDLIRATSAKQEVSQQAQEVELLRNFHPIQRQDMTKLKQPLIL